ncbi:MAG TPA: hypothetical protein VGJ35_00150 [Burkholderiaceae bacterium]|jgi:hypothetical protein
MRVVADAKHDGGVSGIQYPSVRAAWLQVLDGGMCAQALRRYGLAADASAPWST